MNIFPTTSTIGDMASMISIVEKLAKKISIDNVINPSNDEYDEIVRLGDTTIFDSDIADLLYQLKKVEERSGK